MKALKRILYNYTIIDMYRLIRDQLITLFVFGTKVRIIRHPFYVIGKRYMQFGKGFQSGPRLRIEVVSKDFSRGLAEEEQLPSLRIGDNVSFNFNVHIGVVNKMIIGNNVLVGSNVTIIDHNHGTYAGNNQESPLSNPRDRKIVSDPVIIGENVWIAENVVILPGTHIGSGCVIGANAVVKGIFDENQIIIGSPAKPIKKYNHQSKKWEIL